MSLAAARLAHGCHATWARAVPLAASTRHSGGALSTSPLLRAPHFPVSAQLSDTRRSDREASLARELALLSRDAFGQRVFRFSRLNFDDQDRPLVHTYLTELLEHRVPTATPKQIQDYLQLAHVAGFHDACVRLFESRRRAEEAGQVPLPDPDAKIGPNESVVDSVYALKDSQRLLHLAAVAAQCVREARVASTSTSAASPGSVRGQQAAFALVRCLWRAVGLHCHFDHLAATAVSDVAAAHRADADQAAQDALMIYTEYVLPLSQRTQSVSQSRGEHLDDADATEATQGTSAAPKEGDNSNTTETASQSVAWEPSRLLRRLRRLVLYDTSNDDGQMLFHQLCLAEGWLQPPTFTRGSDDQTPSSSSSSLTVDAEHANTHELFYSYLIATCTPGRHVKVALSYYDTARRTHPSRPANSTTTTVPTSPLFAEHELDGELMESAKEAAGAGAGASPPAGALFTTDFVPWRLIMVLQAARDNRLVVRLGRRLLSEGSPIGISLWSLLLISAGETRAADVALHGFHLARSRLTLEGGGGGGGGGGNTGGSGDALSSLFDAGAADGGPLVTVGRHGWEYLLQTSLNALSKCQLSDFEATYLAPAVTDGLLHCTDDFYYACLLQDAHNALDPAERAEALLARMEARGVPLSAGLITRLLKLYLRMESAALLPIYRHAVEELGLYRATWRDELLLWADRRRYMLSAEDRRYVLDQIAQHTPTPVRDHLGGLRTQYALLEYDVRVQPLDVFARTHEPPAEAPTLLDSRVHFVLKKPQLLRQGVHDVACAGEAGGGLQTASTRVLALPQRLTRTAEAAVLSRHPPLRMPSSSSLPGNNAASHELVDGAYRLYLGDLVEGLQRSNNDLPE